MLYAGRTQFVGVILACVVAAKSAAQEGAPRESDNVGPPLLQMSDSSNQAVDYPAGFFEQYRPITALDMVERVPGFQVRSGSGSRGFAGAAGNILIDGERPTTKGDTVSEILERIPAGRVARIELIRGQIGDYDLGGYSVVVNVIRLQDAPLAIKWELELEQDLDSGGPEPRGTISISDRWGETDYNASLEAQRFFSKSSATESLFRGGEIAEDRDEFDRNKGRSVAGNLNTSTRLKETLINFNSEMSYRTDDGLEPSHRVPRDPALPAQTVIETDGQEKLALEVGVDAGMSLSTTFSGKLIVLYSYGDEDGFSAERILDADHHDTQFRNADEKRTESESIVRLEFDWSGLANHIIEFDVEGAFNTLDNALALTLDAGAGPLPVPVPGSNTRVEEKRADIALSDSWSLGSLTLDIELGGETSTISQSGDVTNKRSFTFVKPDLRVTYAPDQTKQARFVFRRNVSQLDFDDFVSTTNFGDDDLDLGNPDLAPQNTWEAKLSYERRFGQIGAVEVTGFYNWINNVVDLVPVGGIFESPGNLGDGKRYGVELEATLPLDFLGLPNARLDIESRWQKSRVTDAVTNDERDLTNERGFTADIEFREDFQAARVAWGWVLEYRGDRTFFGVDELDTFDRDVNLDVFVETNRWLGVKMQVTLQNILDRNFTRDRRVFEGRRDGSSIAFREFRDRRHGLSLVLGITGTL